MMMMMMMMMIKIARIEIFWRDQQRFEECRSSAIRQRRW